MAVGASAFSFAPRNDLSGSSPFTVSLTDLNGDGKQDVVTANYDSNSVSAFINITPPGASTPVFAPKTSFAGDSTCFGALIADINTNGVPDIISVNYMTQTISVYLNTTAPGATTATISGRTDFSTFGRSRTIATGDINSDGKPDLLVSDNNAVAVYLNTTPSGGSMPSFAPYVRFSTDVFPFALTVNDFNGDGLQDIAAATQFSGVSVLLNTTAPGAATPSFTTQINFPAGSMPGSITSKDLNGDGKPEIVVTTSQPSDSIGVLLNLTEAGSTTPVFQWAGGIGLFATPLQKVLINDFNGDGKPDIAALLSLDGVAVWINHTAPGTATFSFGNVVFYSTASGTSNFTSGDLNLDGKIDLLTGNSFSNSMSVFMNTSNIPLPVEMTSFTSSVNGNNVSLNWSTVSEENNKGFDIEKSSFGNGWSKIGFINGAGNTNNTRNYSFTDRGVNSGNYHYRLKQIDYNGNYKYYELANEVIVGVPGKFTLSQNYPNPFNPTTKINYELPANNFVTLKIFDITGREVKELVNEMQSPGYYTLNFNTEGIASGTYFYKLTAGNFSDVKKMVVVK